jgi:hypothetical protein
VSVASQPLGMILLGRTIEGFETWRGGEGIAFACTREATGLYFEFLPPSRL